MALGYCDANKPAMDTIYHLCDRAHNALLRSSSLLSDHSLFRFLLEEFTEVVDEELEEFFGVTKDALNKNEELKIIESERNLLFFILLSFCHLSHFSKLDSDSDEEEDKMLDFGSQVLALWEKYSNNLIHDYAVAA